MDYYQILGVGRTASAEQIRASYLQRVKQVHPDRGGDQEEFLAVQRAYEVLIEPGNRREYDAFLIRVAREKHGPIREGQIFTLGARADEALARSERDSS